MRKSPVTVVLCLVAIAGCQPARPPIPDSTSQDEMQRVPGATFRMGSDLADLDNIRALTRLRTIDPLLAEIPGHGVEVADFYMDTFDVTNGNFLQFARAMPQWRKQNVDASAHNGRYLEHWQDENPPVDLLNHPVTFVTWQAAVAYCNWRGKRLPTEIEYEWAAQDGASRIEYPWGNAPPRNDIVNWSGSGIRTTVPVGSYPPNARGLYDMSGNVWRFTSDPWLGSYAEASERSETLDASASDPTIRRVVRGGSWGANAANLRVRYRDSHRPFDAREMVGFRCAKSPDAGKSSDAPAAAN